MKVSSPQKVTSVKAASLLLCALTMLLAPLGQAEIATINRVPFIATVHLERTVEQGTAPKFKFYLTDFDNKDYTYDDNSEIFEVKLWLDNVLQHTGTYGPGEHEITLPTMNTATDEVRLAIQAKDSQNRKSDLLFQRFRVIDPVAHVITPAQIYSPSASTLQTNFGVYNNDTNAATTTTGLTALMQWSNSNGYRKVILPTGTYRLDAAYTVKVADRLTLDLNGSTFKLEPTNDGFSMMVEIAHAYDSHVINGTIEGDLVGHDYSVDPVSAGTRGIRLAQGAEYSSFENLTIKNIVGYGTNTHLDYVGRVAPWNLSHNPQKSVGPLVLGEIDETTGLYVASTDRVYTPTAIDISTFMSSYGFIQYGKFGGYGSNPVDNWVYRASFYDASGTYISSMQGYLYRRMYPPANAKSVKFTLFSNIPLANKATDVFNNRVPYNCDFINLTHKDIRVAGMVPSGFNNLLVTGCTWENCGWANTKCAFDAEDGWDGMQDLVFRGNTFLTNPNAEFITVGGHNFLIEDNVMKFANTARSGSLHVRNNTIKSAYFRFGPFSRSAYPRIYNNTVEGLTNIDTDYDDFDREYCIRENDLMVGFVSTGGSSRDVTNKMFAYKCDIPGGSVNGRAVGCTINNIATNSAYPTKWFQMEGCTVTNSGLGSSGAGTYSLIMDSIVTNCHMSVNTSTFRLVNNALTNVDLTTSNWVYDQNFWIENNVINTSWPTLITVKNTFNSIGLHNNTITSTGTNFAAIRLSNPNYPSGPQSQYVTVSNNTFSVVSGTAVTVGSVPLSNITLTLGFANNVYNTTVQHSPSLTPLTNVVWVIPPSATMTSPANNSTYPDPATISLTATATDPDGTITKVEFFEGNTKLGEDLVSPYTLSISAPVGEYSITARATDNAGVVGVSFPVNTEVTP